MDYRARLYSPYLNQFSQPDTIVPNPHNPQDWNRYSYAIEQPSLDIAIPVDIFLLDQNMFL